jgi:hydrogenase nickel incorporation protein HypA/HybF
MHELGLVINIIKQIENYMKENDLKKVEKIVLQVGKLSEVYPKYLMDVYPIAKEDTLLKNTELVIEETAGIGKCNDCDFVYNLVENDNICPVCSSKRFSIISGREFLIKEIHAY